MNRRVFVKGVAAAGAASALLSCGKAPRPWRFLTQTEAELVNLISDQIIPRDQDPGAIDAGVVYFIDKQLAGPYQRFQRDYREGLVAVEQTCASMYGKNFAQLSWNQQTRVLQALESGPSARFFEMIRDHCMQGFYGSPRHGGNKDYVSYRMLGLDYPQIIGQNRYS
ncbi:MAG: gluconate 2-dehydrogenase subunit 3 family protein [Acidobacteriota bacterium]